MVEPALLERAAGRLLSIIFLENIFLHFRFSRHNFLGYVGHSEFHLHQLRSILFLSDGFVRFQQLIINNTDLVSPNTQHNLRSVNIRPSRRRRSMTEQSPWISSLWVAVHFSSPVTMRWRKSFLFSAEAVFYKRIQIIRNPSSLFLNHSKRMQSLGNGLAGNS